jgi:hypothetical protein
MIKRRNAKGDVKSSEKKLEQIRKEAMEAMEACMILTSWRNSALRNWERREN